MQGAATGPFPANQLLQLQVGDTAFTVRRTALNQAVDVGHDYPLMLASVVLLET